MNRRNAFEQCVRFVNALEGHEDEIEQAKALGITMDDDELARGVVQRLQGAIRHVQKYPLGDDPIRVLYHVAYYAMAVDQLKISEPLARLIMNHPSASDEYKDKASELLISSKYKLLADVDNQDEQDVDTALEKAYDWLAVQQRHATQPATKQIIDASFIRQAIRKTNEAL